MADKFYRSFFPEEYRVKSQIEEENGYTFYLESTRQNGLCPFCGNASSRVHGHQKRTVRDLPILGKSVTLKITRKKYFCDAEACEADIFAEQSSFIDYYSQFTSRCKEYMLRVATCVNGEAAAKILEYQGIRVSGDTLLNMLRAAGTQYKIDVGKYIGIDDWSYRRGKRYGTIICDLETHNVIDILEGRDGKALEEWLKGHPNIEIVSRDRASAYSRAVHAALPDAVQIADRFHITKNLLDALNEAVKSFIPEVIRIPDTLENTLDGESDKEISNKSCENESLGQHTTQTETIKKTANSNRWQKVK
jgi:transposase